MCGIAGLLTDSPRADHPQLVARMARVLRHRGPDDQGFVSIDPATGEARFGSEAPPVPAPLLFGHRRLSIIDLSPDGRQPMGLPDAPLWITYNGEIYNYVELREELADVAFRTHSDTEVILRAWQKWGPDALSRLNGMFAFALWDGHDLYCARDRFGIKPLSYMIDGGTLLFASEIKAFAFGADVALSIDPAAVAEYFTFQNLFLGRSFFARVRLLEPGHMLRIPLPFVGEVEDSAYWQPRWDGEPIDEAVAAGHLRRRLAQAVSIHLRADVDVGSYLSGGLDTSTIVALAHRPGIHTFTCGYTMEGAGDDERQFDETALSKRVARRFGTVHHPALLTAADLPDLIEKTMYHLEEPRVGISFQNYYICRKISEKVKVVLSGTGGDELFGGYPWRYRRVLDNRLPVDDFYCREWSRLVPDDQKAAFFSAELLEAIRGYRARDSYDAVMAGNAPEEPLNRAFFFDARTFLAGLLIVEDHLSMAHSLESRLPLLENDLAALALALPSSLKVRPADEHLGKWILRRSMDDILPADVLAARKQGFIPPMGYWFRRHLAGYLRDAIGSLVRRGYFAPGVPERYLDEHLAGRANHRAMLWSLLSFELMHRIYIDRRGMMLASE